jgi:hypothetical protein
MRLRLKENPREWQKFTVATVVLLTGVAALLWKRQLISLAAFIAAFALLGVALLACLVCPRWFRPFYRAGMTVSLGIGHVLGLVLLTVLFLCVLTPLACIVRLLGRDLLKLKKPPRASTYWQPASPSEQFDREF